MVLDGFRRARLESGDSVSTADQREYAVRTFLAVAYREQVLADEQARAMNLQPFRPRRKRHPKPVGRRLSRDEVVRLRAAVDTSRFKGRRDLAILDLMLFLALRRQEVITLRSSDFVQDHGEWWVRVEGKGNKERKLRAPAPLLKSIRKWLEVAGVELGVEGSPLFCSVNKGDHLVSDSPINASVVSRLVAEYGHKAGLASRHGRERLAPHDLRRTAARNAYDNGASLLHVQRMLGHSSPSTTERYIGDVTNRGETAADHIRY
jgi:integrase/recombinase XerC